jgi:hypothetical protein
MGAAAECPDPHDAPHDPAHEEQVISYLILRRAIGILGVLFPLLLAVLCASAGSCSGIEDSISAYYHTDVRDLFVGILFTIGWFLYSYKGPDRIDNILANAACGFALGVALCPTRSPVAALQTMHFVCAVGLFLLLAYFSLFLFTKHGPSMTAQKRTRNRVFRICGYVMLACIALIALYAALGAPAALRSWKPVFWLESIALWAFGFSWITKGELLWADHPQQGSGS